MEITSDCARVPYGTLYHNRVFVGRLPGNGTARELADLFSLFGTVCEAKILLDERGCSRRFGFITYASKDIADKVIAMRTLLFKGKTVHIGPGVKRYIHQSTSKEDAEVFQPLEPGQTRYQVLKGSRTPSITVPNLPNTKIITTNIKQPYYPLQPQVMHPDVPLYWVAPVINRFQQPQQAIPTLRSHSGMMPIHPLVAVQKNRSSSLDSEFSLDYNSPPTSPMLYQDNTYLQYWLKNSLNVNAANPRSYGFYN